MTYQDYIKDDSDGGVAYINRKGHQMAISYIAKNGGISGVRRLTNISRPSLYKIKDHARCAPETWEKLYNIMVSQKQTA